MSLNEDELRFKKKNICMECHKYSSHCSNGMVCNPIRKKLRGYSGMRFTSDGFDCALPVAIDTHSVCSFGCLYCFSDNLIQHREGASKPIGQMSLKKIEDVFSGGGGKDAQKFRKALKYDRLNKNGYPAPVQVGAICEPMDNIERNQGWLLKFIELCKKYNQPARLSTKGILALEDEYIEAMAEKPELFWVAFSIISPDDEIMKIIDKRAPVPSERLKAMKKLTDKGIECSLRFRPIIPGISDSTKNHPEAYKELIRKSAEAGARAISYEVVFLPGMMTNDLEKRWKQIEKTSGIPLRKVYKQFGDIQACMRPSHKWTEEIMFAIYNEAKKYGLDVGVSDPNWKQLNDYGCCCGIPPDHPVFGNWERENATNQLVEAKKTGKLITSKDITPPWAKDVKEDNMVNPGVGPKVRYKRKHFTWADSLKETWTDIDKERSPLKYFQGALKPVEKTKDGDIKYKYIGLKRRYPKNTPYWKT